MSDLDQQLQLEHYKLVTDRQKYFTELARESFFFFVKTFTGVAAGLIGLLSARSPLELDPATLGTILRGGRVLVACLGVVTGAQIGFCLARWYGYRQTERSLYSNSPPIKKWWWLFETLYVVAIVVLAAVVWWGTSVVEAEIIGMIPPTAN